MELFAGFSVCVLMLAAVVVVARTFALWRQTGGLPELLLCLYLTGATLLGYPLLIASIQVPPSELWPLHMAGQVVLSLGTTCLLLFTLKVFRSDSGWARGVVGVALLFFTVGVVGYFRELTGPNPRPAAELVGVNILLTTPIAFAYFWATCESFGYHGKLQRQLRLGLARVEVANRVLLWGLMTLAAGIAVVINLVAMLAGSFLSPPVVVVSSCLGLFHACCLFFAFHPPGWYTAWLSRGDEAVAGGRA